MPSIISPLSATATIGQQFTYQIVADSPSDLSATPMPDDLSFDPVLGVIVWSPRQSGSYNIGLTASNSFGATSATLTLSVQPSPSGPLLVNGTSATARAGSRFSFQIVTKNGSPGSRAAAGNLPRGLTLDSATGIISGSPQVAGSYLVTIDVSDGNVTNTATLQLTVVSDPGLPVITSLASASLVPGQSFSYTIVAPDLVDSTDPSAFQLVGNLPSGLGFDPKTGTISGTYTGSPMRIGGLPVERTLSGGVISNVQLFANNARGTSTMPLNFFAAPAGTVNISTRLAIGTDENVLIGGFIITGNAPKKVILRAIGPSLKTNDQPLAGSVADPVLELHDVSGALIGTDDDWRQNQEQEIADTGIPPNDPRESAAVAVLAPGNYTAIVSGKDRSTGIGLVEVYDLGTASFDASSTSKLAQISTRGYVQGGDNVMVGGFIVSAAPTKIVVRGIGPSLASAGVANALSDPLLEVHDGSGALVATNDDWQSDPNAAAIHQVGVAPTDPKESATYQVLAPGAYTSIIRGHGNATGVALVEVDSLQ